MGCFLCVLAAATGQFGEVPTTELVVENTCEYQISVFVRRSSAPPGSRWSSLNLRTGRAGSWPLVSRDTFNIRILVRLYDGTQEELGADNIDFHSLAWTDGPYSLTFTQRGTHYGGRFFPVRPFHAAAADLYTGNGRAILLFRDAGLVGHKPLNPIIRP